MEEAEKPAPNSSNAVFSIYRFAVPRFSSIILSPRTHSRSASSSSHCPTPQHPRKPSDKTHHANIERNIQPHKPKVPPAMAPVEVQSPKILITRRKATILTVRRGIRIVQSPDTEREEWSCKLATSLPSRRLEDVDLEWTADHTRIVDDV